MVSDSAICWYLQQKIKEFNANLYAVETFSNRRDFKFQYVGYEYPTREQLSDYCEQQTKSDEFNIIVQQIPIENMNSKQITICGDNLKK